MTFQKNSYTSSQEEREKELHQMHKQWKQTETERKLQGIVSNSNDTQHKPLDTLEGGRQKSPGKLMQSKPESP